MDVASLALLQDQLESALATSEQEASIVRLRLCSPTANPAPDKIGFAHRCHPRAHPAD